MATAEVTVTHPALSRPVTLEVERDFLQKVTVGNNPMAQKAFAIKVRKKYNETYRKDLNYLPWLGIRITETPASQLRPQGCGCECPGCDGQGHHCGKAARDCYL